MDCTPIGYTADGLPIYARYPSDLVYCPCGGIDPLTGQLTPAAAAASAAAGTTADGITGWFSGVWKAITSFFSGLWDSTSATAQAVKAWVERMLQRTLAAAEWAAIWLVVVVGVVAVAAIVILALVR